MRIFFVISLVFLSALGHSKEATDAFIVYLDQGRIKVVGPSTPTKFVSIVVENKSLSSYHLKLVNKDKNLSFFSVAPGESRSIEAVYDAEKGLSLIPLSPPLSQINLLFGKPPYEIPPKE